MALIDNYPERLTTGYYRVRETWGDAASQVGSFRILSNAIARADEYPGTFVFDNDGNAIYPEPEVAEDEEIAEDEEEANGMDKPAEPPAVEPPVTEQPPAEDVPPADTEPPSGTEAPTEPEPPAENAPDPVIPDVQTGTPDEPVVSDEDDDIDPEFTIMEEAVGEPEEEFPEAMEYANDGNQTVVAYAKLKTLMNVRAGNCLDAEKVTVLEKDTIVEVLQVCANGWLRIRCDAAEGGYAYVSCEEEDYLYGIGARLYTVARKDTLWKIAEDQLDDGTRYADIRSLNGLSSNVIRVGMQLVLPRK